MIYHEHYGNIENIKKIFSMKFKNDFPNVDLITDEFLSVIVSGYDDMIEIYGKAKSLLCPQNMVVEDLYVYILSMKMVISSAFINYYADSYFSQCNAENFPKKVRDLIYTMINLGKWATECGQKKYREIVENLPIISIIISYLYANDINDYSILENFLVNYDYYLKKLNLYRIDFEHNELYQLPYEVIFNNVEALFEKNNSGIIVK